MVQQRFKFPFSRWSMQNECFFTQVLKLNHTGPLWIEIRPGYNILFQCFQCLLFTECDSCFQTLMDALEAMDDELSILKDQLKFQRNISISLTALRKLEDDIIATKVAKISALYDFIDLIISQYRNDLMSNLTFSQFMFHNFRNQ